MSHPVWTAGRIEGRVWSVPLLVSFIFKHFWLDFIRADTMTFDMRRWVEVWSELVEGKCLFFRAWIKQKNTSTIDTMEVFQNLVSYLPSIFFFIKRSECVCYALNCCLSSSLGFKTASYPLNFNRLPSLYCENTFTTITFLSECSANLI